MSARPEPGRALRAALARPVPKLRATACVVLPLALGLVVGAPDLGALASVGGFVGLHAHDRPHASRARALAALGLALAAAMALGTLLAAEPWLLAPVAALVAAAASLVCRAGRLGPPNEYFVVLTLLMGAGLPEDPSAAGSRALTVLAGAALAWAIAVAGAALAPGAPTRRALAGAAEALAGALAARGRAEEPARLQAALAALERASGVVGPAALDLRRLGALEGALVAALRARDEVLAPVGATALDAVRALPRATAPPSPTAAASAAERLLLDEVRAGWASGAEAEAPDRGGVLRLALAEARSGRSLLGPTAARLGLAVGVAVALGAALGLPHGTWVAVGAAAVLQGTNVAVSARRAAHRAAGTVAGVGLAAALFALAPPAGALVAVAALAQLWAEAWVAVSYGVAVLGITPLVLIILDLAHPGAGQALLGARALDTAIGCALGAGAAALLWPGAAAARLPAAQAAALRAGARVLAAARGGRDPRRARGALRAALLDLRAVHADAAADPRRRPEADARLPATLAVERLGAVVLAAPVDLVRAAPGGPEAQLDELADAAASARGVAPALVALEGLPRTTAAARDVARAL